MLRTNEVSDATQACLLRLHDSCVLRGGGAVIVVPRDLLKVRPFLSVFLVNKFPERVVHTSGEKETALRAAAADLFKVFHELTDEVLRSPELGPAAISVNNARMFTRMLYTFFNCLAAWLAYDFNRVLDRAGASLKMLYESMERYPISTPTGAEICRTIVALRSKVSKMYGGIKTLASIDASRMEAVFAAPAA